ncbi:hypothetical protein C7H84_09680 [Burkholderia sp. Nafp2/4-1b]|nr:hypothetical protein C7H84_09680 [Burkholderia sp. Nafp2/4-1b]
MPDQRIGSQRTSTTRRAADASGKLSPADVTCVFKGGSAGGRIDSVQGVAGAPSQIPRLRCGCDRLRSRCRAQRGDVLGGATK